MKVIRLIFGLLVAYAAVTAVVVAFCKLLERLMLRDYGIAAGLSDDESAVPGAHRRIQVYKGVLAPAYFFRDLLFAGAIARALKKFKAEKN